jgi:hypothetical protein
MKFGDYISAIILAMQVVGLLYGLSREKQMSDHYYMEKLYYSMQVTEEDWEATSGNTH